MVLRSVRSKFQKPENKHIGFNGFHYFNGVVDLSIFDLFFSAFNFSFMSFSKIKYMISSSGESIEFGII